MEKNYKVFVLEDYSRMDEIYRLTHDTLMEAGDIQAQNEGVIDSFSEIDNLLETTILIAECNCKIIGTISFTLDSSKGMHVNRWFKKEVGLIRKTVKGSLGVFWRIATHSDFRRERALVLDLMDKAFEVAYKRKCDYALLVSTYRHISLYQRFIGAEIVIKSKESLEGGHQVEIAMMKISVIDGWDIFNKKSRRYLNVGRSYG